MAMRRFELGDLVNRPGTYFNPQTEVLVIVDDSPELDGEIFDLEDAEGADWVLVSDESPIDEHIRDELLERFQTRHSPAARSLAELDEDLDDDGFDDDPDFEDSGFDVQDAEELE